MSVHSLEDVNTGLGLYILFRLCFDLYTGTVQLRHFVRKALGVIWGVWTILVL